jgi:hypothetical protein
MVKKSETVIIDGERYVLEEHHIEETTELLGKIEERRHAYDTLKLSNKCFEEAALGMLAEREEARKSAAEAHNQNKWLGVHNLMLRRALEKLYNATEDPITTLRNSQEAVEAYGVLHSTPHDLENRISAMEQVCKAATQLLKAEKDRYGSYTNRQAIEMVESRHERAWDDLKFAVTQIANI